jgi:sugar fermentation stimulation protein A
VKWESPLLEGIILKRYKRFLADIKLDDNIITAHVANTGSMKSCWESGQKCAISKSENPNRKLPYSLELTHNDKSWIGVNTANANKLAKHWLTENLIEEFSGYQEITPEKTFGKSRIDFYLSGHSDLPDLYVEVKSVTLVEKQIALFPDSISTRGQKHLEELMHLKKAGLRAAMLFIVQREDCEEFRPATEIDPDYAHLLKQAQKTGVEILCLQAQIDLKGFQLKRKLPIILS